MAILKDDSNRCYMRCGELSRLSSAMLKGLRGFDIEKAYAVMCENPFESPAPPEEYADGKGVRALQSYRKYGYIPLDDGVSEGPHVLAKCAQNYRNVIDPVSGFTRGRDAVGPWISPFDPTKRASSITEGVPFQYTFLVLQDIRGLIQLEHGNDGFIARLDGLFRGRSRGIGAMKSD